MWPSILLSLLALCTSYGALASAPSGSWSDYIFAPADRTIKPTAVYRTTGNATGDINSATLTDAGSSITLDFGKEISGFLSFTFGPSNSTGTLSVSFTESPQFVGLLSDDSTVGTSSKNYDKAVTVTVGPENSTWTLPTHLLRGGFRYATIWMNDAGSVAVGNVTTAFDASPHIENLRDYSGYFWSNDDLLNRIWYAGVYTIQTNTVGVKTGRQIPIVRPSGWANNASLGVGPVTMVDGAKRDRAVWPGDMGIAVPTAFVGTYDLGPIKAALQTMVQTQDVKTGSFAECGPPLLQKGSDTYHSWTLIGIYNYYLYTGDLDFVKEVWSNYTFATSYLAAGVDQTGTMNVRGIRDWARLIQGGHNAEANAIYYRVLTTASFLASELGLESLSQEYAANATSLKAAFHTNFWVSDVGMYKDNETDTTLYPQDANSLAIIYNVTLEPETQFSTISSGLTRNWGPYGAEAPELPQNISPFIGGFELEAHFMHDTQRALDFMRLEWGFAMNTNLSVQSTLLEGWTTAGTLDYRSYRGYGYDPSYTSHAHGWSSAPTSLLSFYVVGMKMEAPLGKVWSFAPQPGDLKEVKGGYETTLGRFDAEYKVDKNGDLQGWFKVPDGTRGTVTLPGEKVVISGKIVTGSKGKVVAKRVRGGKHKFRTYVS